ncbi:hypothetical protein ACFOVU_18545 [Nocardiopsis sediminis]|uniref:Helix-turn-helix domain-containing protein n=1 Tax=Nocardiopsis sediminis TaxID=1778267 RepID=A0ABV8FPD2_9ACTN
MARRKRKKKTNPMWDGADLERAVECPVCAKAGIVNPPGTRRPADPDPAQVRPSGPTVRLNADQAAVLRRAWTYLADAGIGDDPDTRLLALVCLLRGARTGRANLLGQDLRALRLREPMASLTALTSSGWLEVVPERVLEADAANPASCGIPAVADNPWRLGKNGRSRISGWASRVLAHKKLRKKPNPVRLVALHTVAHSSPDGRVHTSGAALVTACALDGTPELDGVVTSLAESGWLEPAPQTVRGTDVVGRLGRVAVDLAPRPADPGPAPARAADDGDALSPEDVDKLAHAAIAGREPAVARWVEGYRGLHGHGPSWATVAAAQGWPADRAVRNAVFARLHDDGWLAGFKVAYGLRPGPRHCEQGEG